MGKFKYGKIDRIINEESTEAGEAPVEEVFDSMVDEVNPSAEEEPISTTLDLNINDTDRLSLTGNPDPEQNLEDLSPNQNTGGRG